MPSMPLGFGLVLGLHAGLAVRHVPGRVTNCDVHADTALQPNLARLAR